MVTQKKRTRAVPQRHSDRHAVRYVASPGARFGDDKAALYGAELERIAGENAIDGVASLDKRLVYTVVEADPTNPLREFVFNSTDKDAARAHRIERCGILLRSIRVVAVTLGPRARPVPQFLTVPDSIRRRMNDGGIERRQRSRMLTLDVMKSDPLFAAAVGVKIRLVLGALIELEKLTTPRSPSREVTKLKTDLRVAFDGYLGSIISDVAAEE